MLEPGRTSSSSPETQDSYEAGLKNACWDGPITVGPSQHLRMERVVNLDHRLKLRENLREVTSGIAKTDIAITDLSVKPWAGSGPWLPFNIIAQKTTRYSP